MKLTTREMLIYITGILLQPQQIMKVNDKTYLGYSDVIIESLMKDLQTGLDDEAWL